MGHLIPTSFMDLIGAVALIVAIAFTTISIRRSTRHHFQKMSGLMFLVAIGIFSDNIWCYLALIFIVGTAITELDFLQNIAAIIRGNEAYFRYKKEFIPSQEVEQTISEELQESSNNLESVGNDTKKDEISFPLDKKKLSNEQLYVIAEELTFRYLERKFNATISRHVRYNAGGSVLITFDGVIETTRNHILFEIIIPKSPHFLILNVQKKSSYITHAKYFEEMAKKPVEIWVIIVGDIPQRFVEQFNEQTNNMAFSIHLQSKVVTELVSFKELGL